MQESLTAQRLVPAAAPGANDMRLRVADPRVLAFALGVIILAPVYYALALIPIGTAIFSTYALHTLAFALVVLFGYEFYFTVQRIDLARRTFTVHTKFDDLISFSVSWTLILRNNILFVDIIPNSSIARTCAILLLSGRAFPPVERSACVCLMAHQMPIRVAHLSK